ncbi:MAG: biosis protein MshJ [Pseudomonadota bacterium]|nr:biosis protein MshJ [Pseudomonadota bacterium]
MTGFSWSELAQHLDAWPVRQRLLLLAAALAVGWLLLDGFWLGPMQTALKGEIQRTEQLQTLQQSLAGIKMASNDVLKVESQQQITAIRREMAEQDVQLRRELAQCVMPQRLADLLTDPLEGQRQLELLALHNEPPSAIALTTLPDAGAPTLYRHGLVIELAGNYLTLLAYLRKVEALPWQLFWDSLQLEVIDFTTRHIRLRVHTLSLSDATAANAPAPGPAVKK